jgi:hypothetical protein
MSHFTNTKFACSEWIDTYYPNRGNTSLSLCVCEVSEPFTEVDIFTVFQVKWNNRDQVILATELGNFATLDEANNYAEAMSGHAKI